MDRRRVSEMFGAETIISKDASRSRACLAAGLGATGTCWNPTKYVASMTPTP